MRRWYRLQFLSCLLAVCLSAPAAGASPSAADSTDEAFGLLLVIPGAPPVVGGWIIPIEAERNEQDLIAHWQRLVKGGQCDAPPRHATGARHPPRSGARATNWLLANSTNARTVVADGRTTSAYDLAGQHQRAAFVRVLETQYGFAPAPPPMPAAQLV